MTFQSSINQWEIHKAIALLDGVEIDPPDPEPVRNPRDLTRYYLQHYKPQDSESPCQTLDQLESYRLSVPVTEVVELTDPVAIYQSLDVCVGTNMPYKCHLKDKAKFKSVARNPNNILAASWPLHQMLDGLNNLDRMSVVKLSVAYASDSLVLSQDNRFAVTLQLGFFHKVDASSFQPRNGAKKLNEKVWQTTVYVKDKNAFVEFVKWKANDTQNQWDRYRASLNSM